MIFDDAIRKAKDLIAQLFREERKAHIDAIIAEASRHMPTCTYESYRQHMQTRHRYRLGAMQADMRDVLKRRFPNTWKEIEREQVNLKVFKRENAERAKTFLRTGRFYLVDDAGEEIQDDNFNDMLKDCEIMASLTEMDRARRSEERCMFKPWWNESRGHVQIDVWPCYLTWIVPHPDPLKRYDVDQALLVAFEHEGLGGPTDTDRLYECWSILPEDMADELGQRTMHFMTSQKGDYQVNSNDVFEYSDPRNGDAPIYPFTWFRHDKSTALYVVGDEDALTANRMLNAGLTDMVQGMHVMMFGTWAHRQSPTDPKPLTMQTMGGGRVIELGSGEDLTDLTPHNLPIDQYLGFWKEYLTAAARIENLSASVVEKQEPEASGVALKIRRIGQIEDREEQIAIIREDVEEAVYRMALVHNAHCLPERRIGLEGVSVRWEAGQPDIPSDEEQSMRIVASRKALNLTTAVHERMLEMGEDYETAKKAVEEMAELNRELAKLGSVTPLVETAFEHARREGGEDALELEPEPEPAASDTEPKSAAAAPSGSGAIDKMNIYQWGKMIEQNAATAIDMRMAGTGEDYETARRKVEEAIAFNMEMAVRLGEKQAAEQALIDAASVDSSPAAAPPPTGEAEAEGDEEVEEEIEE